MEASSPLFTLHDDDDDDDDNDDDDSRQTVSFDAQSQSIEVSCSKLESVHGALFTN